MKKELTDIDKTIRKIGKLLDNHIYLNERLELQQVIANRTFNLYLVGRFSNGSVYEQKHIATISVQH